jgi:hypothetical protein
MALQEPSNLEANFCNVCHSSAGHHFNNFEGRHQAIWRQTAFVKCVSSCAVLAFSVLFCLFNYEHDNDILLLHYEHDIDML